MINSRHQETINKTSSKFKRKKQAHPFEYTFYDLHLHRQRSMTCQNLVYQFVMHSSLWQHQAVLYYITNRSCINTYGSQSKMLVNTLYSYTLNKFLFILLVQNIAPLALIHFQFYYSPPVLTNMIINFCIPSKSINNLEYYTVLCSHLHILIHKQYQQIPTSMAKIQIEITFTDILNLKYILLAKV